MKYRVKEITIRTITDVYYVEADSEEEAREIYDMKGEFNARESVVGDKKIDDIVVEEV